MEKELQEFVDALTDSLQVLYDRSDSDEIARQRKIIMLKMHFLLSRAADSGIDSADLATALAKAVSELPDD